MSLGSLFFQRNGNAAPQWAAVNVSTLGANIVVADPAAGHQIVVMQYVLVADGQVSVTWESSDGTAASGEMSLAENGGVSTAHNPQGHFATLAGKGLNLHLNSGVIVGGHVQYIVI